MLSALFLVEHLKTRHNIGPANYKKRVVSSVFCLVSVSRQLSSILTDLQQLSCYFIFDLSSGRSTTRYTNRDQGPGPPSAKAEMYTSFVCRNVTQVVGRFTDIFLPWRQKISVNLLVENEEEAIKPLPHFHFYYMMLGVRGKIRFPRCSTTPNFSSARARRNPASTKSALKLIEKRKKGIFSMPFLAGRIPQNRRAYKLGVTIDKIVFLYSYDPPTFIDDFRCSSIFIGPST